MFYCTQFKIAYAKELLSIFIILLFFCEHVYFFQLLRMTWETKESIDYIEMILNIRFIKDRWIWWHLRLLMKLRRKRDFFFTWIVFNKKATLFVTAWMEKSWTKESKWLSTFVAFSNNQCKRLINWGKEKISNLVVYCQFVWWYS